METRERIWPDIAIPPGEFLADTLAAVGMSQAELARRMGRPAQAINEIIQGKKEITPETALQLQRVLGTPAHVWVGLDADYRFLKAKLEEPDALEAEVPEAEAFPYWEMASKGWLPNASDAVERTRNLLQFFGVVSFKQLQLPAAAWRRAGNAEPSVHALAAWLREGERRAQRATVAEYDAEALRSLLPRLRALTLDVENFEERLRQWFGECGVIVVFVPELRNTGAHGATRWIGKNPVMQLSIYRRWWDSFWFTVFHETVHILKHAREVYIEYENGTGGIHEEAEAEANQIAGDILIPPKDYARFVAMTPKPYSERVVRDFADRLGIHTSILIGRLHRDKHLPYSHLNKRGLRPRLLWKEDAE